MKYMFNARRFKKKGYPIKFVHNFKCSSASFYFEDK